MHEGDEAPHEAQTLSTSRLFLVVVVFLALAGYAIWNSDRFQSLFQGVSEQRLSELLQRPVSFRRVDFTVFPPSIHLADVRVGNDPRAAGGPLLEAEELTIGGGVSVTGGELRFGRVRALHPKIAIVQFPDGSWNLPPGLSRPASKGGLSVKIGELVVQSGTFEFQGRKSDMDGRLENFAAELASLPGNNYRGSLACRRTTLRLSGDEPLVFGVDLGFRAGPASGLQIDTLRIVGDFGELRASGSVEDLKNPGILLRAAGELHVAEVERVFHSALGFAGDARVDAELSLPPEGGFRIAGRLAVAALDAKGFAIEGLEATVLARPEALIAHIEKGRYAGGDLSGLYRIENLAGGHGRPSPMTLSLDGKGIQVERFFGDLKLPGTGLSGAAALSATLRWSEGGIAHANGAARLSIAPGPAVSIVRGRFGIPIGGGGDLAVVDGRIGFEGTEFRFPASTLAATGGLRIGEWMPDFDFQLRSRDLAEIDRLFQNFVGASGSVPSPLGFGGSGEVEGHIAKSWGDPDVTAKFSAENTRYGGVLFGSVRGAADMHDGAFLFHPLRAYEGSATISLEGTARYRKDPGPPDPGPGRDGQGFSGIALPPVPGPRLPDRGPSDRELSHRRQSVRGRHGLRRRGPRRRGDLGAEGLAHHRAHGADAGALHARRRPRRPRRRDARRAPGDRVPRQDVRGARRRRRRSARVPAGDGGRRAGDLRAHLVRDRWLGTVRQAGPDGVGLAVGRDRLRPRDPLRDGAPPVSCASFTARSRASSPCRSAGTSPRRETFPRRRSSSTSGWTCVISPRCCSSPPHPCPPATGACSRRTARSGFPPGRARSPRPTSP